MAKNIPRKKSKSKETKSELRERAIQEIKRKQMINFGLGAILLILVVFGTTLLYFNSVEISDDSPEFVKALSSLNSQIFGEKETVVVIINEESITQQGLDARYELIPQEYKQFITKEAMLEQMIDEIVLIQHAEEQGIKVSSVVVDDYIINLSIQAQTTPEEFETLLKNNGLSMEEAREFYRKSLMLNELLKQEILLEIEVTENDIKEYYDENLVYFTTPETLNVSHILICHNQSLSCVSTNSYEEAQVISQNVKNVITNDNFGEVALKNSEEPGVQITQGNLGWISRESPIDPDFLSATFELELSEVSEPVETQFGFHIIKVWDKRAEETLDLDVVSYQINQTLMAQKQSEVLFDYVSELRNESLINYIE